MQSNIQQYLLVWLLCLLLPATVAAVDNDNYRIGSGDSLSITVFGEEDMSLKEVKVGTNGNISFPLLGEIAAEGQTVRSLEQEVERRLKDGYLKKPVVTVSVLEYRFFYVNGEVENPGGYNYVDGLTVQKAVALAGGFTERASKRKIILQHENADSESQRVGLDIEVNPGDIITVGESFF